MVGAEPLDDLVQETFVKVWKERHRFQGDSQIRTWIYRIAVNTAKDYLKKKSRDPNLTVEGGRAQAPTTSLELREGIEKSIQLMDMPTKAPFVLFYKMELSVKEVAESLEMPQGTVKSRLHKARKEFLENLKKLGFEYDG
jgi:RNA polymerase sigma-70 factor (ECF subfamily)